MNDGGGGLPFFPLSIMVKFSIYLVLLQLIFCNYLHFEGVILGVPQTTLSFSDLLEGLRTRHSVVLTAKIYTPRL